MDGNAKREEMDQAIQSVVQGRPAIKWTAIDAKRKEMYQVIHTPTVVKTVIKVVIQQTLVASMVVLRQEEV